MESALKPIEISDFIETVYQMRKAQTAVAQKIDPAEVKRLEAAVDIRVGLLRQALQKKAEVL